MRSNRGCGILLHITSLPSEFGIGDLGPESYKFADFLHDSKVKYWQVLPLNPTSSLTGNSPYSSDSAFAGNILLISPEVLVEEGLIEKSDLRILNNTGSLEIILKKKISLLKKAHANFQADKSSAMLLNKFKKKHNYWLRDYSLFKISKIKFNNRSWTNWPAHIKNREKNAIKRFTEINYERVCEQMFFQFIFFRQWFKLKDYCNRKNISIIGDIPFYISHESADVWSFPNYFKLDKDKMPAFVGGVPPDYFSKSGQLWGNPVYNWNILKRNDFDWWLKRIKHNLSWTDVLRLDHFRAFSAYWEVPAKEKTAVNGKWIKVPGEDFFLTLKLSNKNLPIIAEDLGDIDQPVRELIKKFKFPGMRVLQFAFDSNIKNSPDVPHRHVNNCIVYTGTHDNPTTRAWFRKSSDENKKKVIDYSGVRVNEKNAAENFVRMAMMSVAGLCIIPMQDFLNLGDEATMNRPGTSAGNWKWRLHQNQLTPSLQKHISKLVMIYERS